MKQILIRSMYHRVYDIALLKRLNQNENLTFVPHNNTHKMKAETYDMIIGLGPDGYDPKGVDVRVDNFSFLEKLENYHLELCGPPGSGKSTLLKLFNHMGLTIFEDIKLGDEVVYGNMETVQKDITYEYINRLNSAPEGVKCIFDSGLYNCAKYSNILKKKTEIDTETLNYVYRALHAHRHKIWPVFLGKNLEEGELTKNIQKRGRPFESEYTINLSENFYKDSDKVLVVLSGGIDSTVVLHEMVEKHSSRNVVAVTFDYGNRAKQEISIAIDTCFNLGVLHEILPLTNAFNFAGVVPKVAPFRNDIMKLYAANVALQHGCNIIVSGENKTDWVRKDATYFPDCSIRGKCMISELIGYQYGDLTFNSPLIDKTKTEVVELSLKHGLKMGEDYMSCYTPVDGKHCMECESCKLLAEAIKEVENK